MKIREIKKLEHKLDEYIESFVIGMGREERRRALGWYITGLLLDGERKSIEPMAGRLVESADEIEAMRQRLQQAVAVARRSELEVYKRLALKFERELPSLKAFVLDDTGFPKAERTRLALPASVRGRSVALTSAKSQRAFMLPATGGAGALGCGSTCPRNGRRIANAVRRRAFLMTSSSSASGKSRWT